MILKLKIIDPYKRKKNANPDLDPFIDEMKKRNIIVVEAS